MIVCNIKGGIGNQLFQYSCARAISKSLGTDMKIDIVDATKHNSLSSVPRRVSICDLNINAEVATDSEAARLRYRHGALSYLYQRIKEKFFPSDILNFDSLVADSVETNRYLDGYFQSYKYFSDIRPLLLNELTLRSPSQAFFNWEDMIAKLPNPVSIHIRRGDYVSNENTRREFGPCPINYFERAIIEIEEEIKGCSYVVFSDDIEWVQKNLTILSEKNVLFVHDKNLTDIEELLLMSTCSHNIISNSSFSWWAAWLNQNEQKRVITPTPWLDSGIIDESGLIPPEWLQINKYVSQGITP